MSIPYALNRHSSGGGSYDINPAMVSPLEEYHHDIVAEICRSSGGYGWCSRNQQTCRICHVCNLAVGTYFPPFLCAQKLRILIVPAMQEHPAGWRRKTRHRTSNIISQSQSNHVHDRYLPQTLTIHPPHAVRGENDHREVQSGCPNS